MALNTEQIAGLTKVLEQLQKRQTLGAAPTETTAQAEARVAGLGTGNIGGSSTGGTPSSDDTYLKSLEDRLASTNKLISDYESKVSAIPTATSLYDTLAEKIGLSSKQKAYEDISKQVSNVEDLISNLEKDVGTRASGKFLLSDAAKRREVATEGKPLREQLVGLLKGQATAQTGLTGAQDELKTLLGLGTSDIATQRELATSGLATAKSELSSLENAIAAYKKQQEDAKVEAEAKLAEEKAMKEAGLGTYYKTQEAIASSKNEILSPTEAKTLGVPYGTTVGQAAAMGIVPKGTAGEGMTTSQMNAFNSIVNKYNTSPLVAAASRATPLKTISAELANDKSNPALQVSFIYGLIQALDTYQSAVREGEIGLVQSTQGVGDQIKNLPDRILKGSVMSGDTVDRYIKVADTLIESINKAAAKKEQSFAAQAQTVGLGDEWKQFISGASPSYSNMADVSNIVNIGDLDFKSSGAGVNTGSTTKSNWLADILK